jgi:hypothetical protein
VARRRSVEVFSLSFLDCICCGFGAVILFYTIISAHSGIARTRQTDDLRAEVNKLEEEVLVGTRNLVVLRNTLEKTQSETASDAARITKMVTQLQSKRRDMAAYDDTSLARREHIEKLKADIQSLEAGTRRLEGGSTSKGPSGADLRAFRNTGGERHYITGLKLRGKLVFILVDRSASMLHQDLVNVLVLRNQDDAHKRAAAKWRRAIDTVGWLVTQLPPDSKFQVYAFNTQAASVLPATTGKWLDSNQPALRDRSVEALAKLVPAEGTSLANAFASTKKMLPFPDQIILITDGLPTQGKTPGLRKYIDASARARLFDDSLVDLPKDVPVDIVLLPMKGDLPAAHRFWALARATNGILYMPSKDWP